VLYYGTVQTFLPFFDWNKQSIKGQLALLNLGVWVNSDQRSLSLEVKVKAVIVILLIVGLLYIAWVKLPSWSINERVDEHGRPTGKAPTIPTVAVIAAMTACLFAAASALLAIAGD